MTFYQAAKPFIQEKLNAYSNALSEGRGKDAFRHLEDAHVIGQHSTKLHCVAHYYMLKHGLKHGDVKECLGQILRLIGAFTKTAVGFIPNGNTGGANISPFKPLPISQSNQIILDKIKHAQSQS